LRKQALCFVLIASLCGMLFASAYNQTDDDLAGASIRGLSFSGDYATMFANPAALTRSTAGLYVHGYYKDSASAQVGGAVNQPTSGTVLSFCGTNLAFTLEMTNTLSERTTTSSGDTYRGTNATRLQLDWAYAFRQFSIGLSFKATSFATRFPLELSNGQRFFDYVVETTFKRYDEVYGSTVLSAGFGMLLDYDWLRLALTSTELASVSTSTGALSFSFSGFYRSLSVGMTLSTPTFTKEGQLNFCKAYLTGELLDIGDSDNSSGNLSLVLKFQFLPDYQLALLTGVSEPKKGNVLKSYWSEGTESFGIALLLGSFHVNLSASFPFTLYSGDSSASVTYRLSASYVH
jgi:hypothetical protein